MPDRNPKQKHFTMVPSSEIHCCTLRHCRCKPLLKEFSYSYSLSLSDTLNLEPLWQWSNTNGSSIIILTMSARKPFTIADGNRQLPLIRSVPPQKRHVRPKTAQEWAAIDKQYDFLTNPDELLLDAETPRTSNCEWSRVSSGAAQTTTAAAAAFLHGTGHTRAYRSHSFDPAAPPSPPLPLLTNNHRKSKRGKSQKGQDDAYATLRQKRKLLWKRGLSLTSIPELLPEDASDSESSHTSSSSEDDSRMDISSEESDEEDEEQPTSGDGAPPDATTGDLETSTASDDEANNMSSLKSPPHPVHQANHSSEWAIPDANTLEAVAATTAPAPLSHHQKEHAHVPKTPPSILNTASTGNRGLDQATMPLRQAFRAPTMMEENAPSTNNTVSTGAAMKPFFVFPRPSVEAFFTPNPSHQSEDSVRSATEFSSNRLKDVSDFTASQRKSTTPPNLPTLPAGDESASRIKTGGPTIPSPTGTHKFSVRHSNQESTIQARPSSRDNAQQGGERIGNVPKIGNATSKNQRAATEPERVPWRPWKKLRADPPGRNSNSDSTRNGIRTRHCDHSTSTDEVVDQRCKTASALPSVQSQGQNSPRHAQIRPPMKVDCFSETPLLTPVPGALPTAKALPPTPHFSVNSGTSLRRQKSSMSSLNAPENLECSPRPEAMIYSPSSPPEITRTPKNPHGLDSQSEEMKTLSGAKTPVVATKTQGLEFENQDSCTSAASAAAGFASIAEETGSKKLYQTVSAAVKPKQLPLDPVAKRNATPPGKKLSSKHFSKPALLDHERLQDDARGSLATETTPVAQVNISEVPNQEKRINSATLSSHSAPESLGQEGVAGSPTQHSNVSATRT